MDRALQRLDTRLMFLFRNFVIVHISKIIIINRFSREQRKKIVQIQEDSRIATNHSTLSSNNK